MEDPRAVGRRKRVLSRHTQEFFTGPVQLKATRVQTLRPARMSWGFGRLAGQLSSAGPGIFGTFHKFNKDSTSKEKASKLPATPGSGLNLPVVTMQAIASRPELAGLDFSLVKMRARSTLGRLAVHRSLRWASKSSALAAQPKLLGLPAKGPVQGNALSQARAGQKAAIQKVTRPGMTVLRLGDFAVSFVAGTSSERPWAEVKVLRRMKRSPILASFLLQQRSAPQSQSQKRPICFRVGSAVWKTQARLRLPSLEALPPSTKVGGPNGHSADKKTSNVEPSKPGSALAVQRSSAMPFWQAAVTLDLLKRLTPGSRLEPEPGRKLPAITSKPPALKPSSSAASVSKSQNKKDSLARKGPESALVLLVQGPLKAGQNIRRQFQDRLSGLVLLAEQRTSKALADAQGLARSLAASVIPQQPRKGLQYAGGVDLSPLQMTAHSSELGAISPPLAVFLAPAAAAVLKMVSDINSDAGDSLHDAALSFGRRVGLRGIPWEYAKNGFPCFALPVQGGWLSSKYGWREGRFHQGIDIAVEENTTITAAAAGTVVYVGWAGGYGKIVHLDHGDGCMTLYAHCNRLLVKKGQQVKRRQRIALSGNTGRSTGPHLHFEIQRDSKALDPLIFLPKL